jgi:hypothetical protein
MSKWVKPTLSTKYHIDFDWWTEQNLDFRAFLSSQLCEACQKKYANPRSSEMVDWVDPVTAEVKRVDALWQALKSCCSSLPDYITESTPLTSAVLRVFLANDNVPLTPAELADKLGARFPADMILRALSRGPVYRGIKPMPAE